MSDNQIRNFVPNLNGEVQVEMMEQLVTHLIATIPTPWGNGLEDLLKDWKRLKEALDAAYVENQNMHCYRLSENVRNILTDQTRILRTALATFKPTSDAPTTSDVSTSPFKSKAKGKP